MNNLLDAPVATIPQLSPEDLIQEFSINLSRFSYQDLFNVLEKGTSLIIKVIIRAAIHAKEDNKSFTLTLQRAEIRARQAENTRRKNFIRRTFKKWGLFAIHEINILIISVICSLQICL